MLDLICEVRSEEFGLGPGQIHSLEAANTDAHDDQTDGECRNGSVGIGDDRRKGRDDQHDMTDQRKANGDHDCVVPPEVLIGNVRTDQWHDVGPKGID